MIEFITSDLVTSALLWLIPILGGVSARLLHRHLKWKRGAEMLSRLGDLAARAVVAVHAEFTSVIRDGRADGHLTVEERALAKTRALGKLREYCGFDDLQYVVGSVPRAEVALNDAVESALVAAKAAGVVPRVPKGPGATLGGPR